MPALNLISILIATAVAFIGSGIYYTVIGDRLATAREQAAPEDRPPPWTYLVELVRTSILATVVTAVVSLGMVDTWQGCLLLGLVLWVGFPFVLWAGAMLHEGIPLRFAAIHAGDWLIKLPVSALIVAVMQ